MGRKLIATIACVALVLFTFAGCASNTSSNDGNVYQKVIETARTEIWNLLLSGSNTNAAIAIMDNDKIIYSEAFGMRDIDNSIPVDTNTQFNIGSGSKMFATTAIMLLCDQGKVELDKPVTTYLPEFSMKDARYKDITVRMLLNHTAGFPGSNCKNDSTTVKNRNYIKETISLLAESTLKSTPGDISVYCNDGFTVAEAIVEKVSGTSYGDFLDKNVFSKLNMQNSSAYFKDGNSNIAITVNASKGANNPKEYMNPLGAGGISSTAEDLCRFAAIFYSDSTFFKSESLKELLKPQYGPKTVPIGVPFNNRGLGWDSVAVDGFEQQNVIALKKIGQTNEYISNLCVIPKEKLSVVITLGGGISVDSISTDVMQALLECKGIVKKLEDKQQLSLKTVAIPEDAFSYKGYYCRGGELSKIDFDRQSNTGYIYDFDGDKFTLNGNFQYKEDGYFYDNTNKKFKFITKDGAMLIAYYPPGNSTKISSIVENIKKGTESISTSNFDNKLWMPCNANFYEISSFSMAKTLRSNELPSYVLYKFTDQGYTASKLLDKNTTGIALRYSKNLYEPKIITDNGLEVFKLGGCEFVDASKLGILKANTKVVIGEKGFNESRVVDKETIFKCNVGDKCRIVVLSPDGTCSYDSLYDGAKEIVINKGSYVSFIGDAGTTFEPQITQ